MRHLLVTLLLACAAPARAHAPVELWRIVTFAPELVITTNRGIVFGALERGDFRLVCAESLQLGLGGRYQLVQPRPGLWLLGSEAGLFRSEDHGCSWVDLNVGPSADLIDSAGMIYSATRGVLASEDEGAHWRTLYPATEHETLVSLLALDGVVYASGFVGDPPSSHFLLRSTDRGATWDRLALALEEGERELTLLAAKSSTLVARATARKPEQGERILRSLDQGASFTPVARLRLARAAAFVGEDLFVAGVDGVFQVADAPAEPLGASAWVSALDAHQGALLACGYYDGFDVGRNGIGAWHDGSFTNWFSFAEVTQLPSCRALAGPCAAPMHDYTLENARFERPLRLLDAGASDAGADDAGSPIAHDARVANLDGSLDAAPERGAIATTPAEPRGCALHPRGGAWLALLSLAGRRRGRARACARS